VPGNAAPNTKLKLVKRQMYGRAKLDLQRARLIGA
jgi:transposase